MQKLIFHPFQDLSKVWDDEADKDKIQSLLNKKHAAFLRDESFEITDGVTKEHMQLTVTLKKHDDSTIYPIEIICVHHDYPKINKMDIANLIIDYVDLYWTSYFKESRELFLPIDFAQFEYEGLSFYMRGFIRRLNLEREADSFLAQHGYGEHDISPISSET